MKNNVSRLAFGTVGIFISFISQACEIGKSRYELLANKDFSAQFNRHQIDDKSSDLILNLTSKKTNQNYWFRLNAGNGYSSLTLTPIKKPLEQSPIKDLDKTPALQQPIYFIKKDLSFYPSELSNNLPAPQYFLATNLGEALWYEAANLGATDDIKENMPRGLFKLKGCN